MSAKRSTTEALANGGGGAALLAAGIGWLALAVLAIAADQNAWMKNAMTFSKATGPLSGVTTTAVAVWVVVWVALHLRWKRKSVEMGKVSAAALVLLVLGLLLTFPPIADLF